MGGFGNRGFDFSVRIQLEGWTPVADAFNTGGKRIEGQKKKKKKRQKGLLSEGSYKESTDSRKDTCGMPGGKRKSGRRRWQRHAENER